MSRHPGASGSIPSSSTTSPRPAAERRVLEQLAQQPPNPRRTLPRPATPPVDPNTPARLRRPRSRIFGASAPVPDAPPHGNSTAHLSLTNILAEFPEIDATTVSVLLDMHNGQRAPVVQRLAEVYRRPGKEPQKRHSFPSSSPQERGRADDFRPSSSSSSMAPTERAKKSRVFSIDRIDDTDEEESLLRLDLDAAVDQASRPNAHVTAAVSSAMFSDNGGGGGPMSTSRSSQSPGFPSSRPSHTSTTSSSRKRSFVRRSGIPGADSSGASGESPPMEVPLLAGRRRLSRNLAGSSSDTGSRRVGSGSSAGTAMSGRSSRTSTTRREERESDPLRPPWGQEIAPRPKGDVLPPVMLAPAALRRQDSGLRERTSGAGSSQTDIQAAFAAVTIPHTVPVVAEQSTVRLRGEGTSFLRSGLHLGVEESREEDGESASSSGTASSLTVPTYPSSRSSLRSMGRSAPRSTGEGEQSSGRESTARAAAGALMRGLTTREKKGSNVTPPVDGQMKSRRHRASRSVRGLGHVMKQKARQYRDGWSDGDGDEEGDEEEEEEQLLDREEEMKEADGDEELEEEEEESQEIARSIGLSEVMRIEDSEVEYVRVEVGELQRLVRKVNEAEEMLQELQTHRAARMEALVGAVEGVHASLVKCDKRQQQRFEDVNERFTANNDGIERLLNDMWRVKKMLHDYETRRSRRFWRVVGMLLLDALAYIGLFVVWLFTSVYNMIAKQKRAVARLFSSKENSEAQISSSDEATQR